VKTIVKIGLLPKLWSKVKCIVFLRHSVNAYCLANGHRVLRSWYQLVAMQGRPQRPTELNRTVLQCGSVYFGWVGRCETGLKVSAMLTVVSSATYSAMWCCRGELCVIVQRKYGQTRRCFSSLRADFSATQSALCPYSTQQLKVIIIIIIIRFVKRQNVKRLPWR